MKFITLFLFAFSGVNSRHLGDMAIGNDPRTWSPKKTNTPLIGSDPRTWSPENKTVYTNTTHCNDTDYMNMMTQYNNAEDAEINYEQSISIIKINYRDDETLPEIIQYMFSFFIPKKSPSNLRTRKLLLR